MKCIRCQFENPATVTFCKKCGGAMDLSAEEIESALVDAQKIEKKQAAEQNMRNSLFFSMILFGAAVTFYVFSGGGPEETYSVPSGSRDTDYLQMKPAIDYEPRIEKAPLFAPPKRVP
jgi:hypothetical protein